MSPSIQTRFHPQILLTIMVMIIFMLVSEHLCLALTIKASAERVILSNLVLTAAPVGSWECVCAAFYTRGVKQNKLFSCFYFIFSGDELSCTLETFEL